MECECFLVLGKSKKLKNFKNVKGKGRRDASEKRNCKLLGALYLAEETVSEISNSLKLTIALYILTKIA